MSVAGWASMEKPLIPWWRALVAWYQEEVLGKEEYSGLAVLASQIERSVVPVILQYILRRISHHHQNHKKITSYCWSNVTLIAMAADSVCVFHLLSLCICGIWPQTEICWCLLVLITIPHMVYLLSHYYWRCSDAIFFSVDKNLKYRGKKFVI